MTTMAALRDITADGVSTTISGMVAPAFEGVLDTFAENFRDRRELGASFAIYLDGEKVVDLWGGHVDPARTTPWQENTMVGMASVIKGVMAMGLHLLADRGKIDYGHPVAKYWPEFAQAGKENITVRQLISHHAALHFADASKPGDLTRWQPLIRAIEQQTPEWEPGTRGVYHTITIMPILGELVTRVAGEPYTSFHRREIIEALGVDYVLGLGPAELARYSPDYETEHFVQQAGIAPEVLARFFQPVGTPADLSDEERANPGFTGGAGTARGLARLFSIGANGGRLDGRQVLSPDTIALMTEEQWYAKCAVWGTPMRVALGLLLNDPEFFYVGPNPRAFGTAGAGGSFGMADRERRLAIGYGLNRWWPAFSLGDRARTLVDATYECL